MFKLIRDNIPELAEKSGQTIDVAVAQSDAFYKKLLNTKLVEEANEYLKVINSTGDIDPADVTNELVDIMTVVGALYEAYGISKEDFNKAYKAKMEERGGFTKRYIGFFQDPQPQQPTQSN